MNCCCCSKPTSETVNVSNDNADSSSPVHRQLDNEATEVESTSDVSAREQLDNARDTITAEDVAVSSGDETRNVQNQSKTSNGVSSGYSYEDKRWRPLKLPVEYTR